MNIIPTFLQPVIQAARALLMASQLQLRQAARNPSISARLGISFGAVALLAIVANLIVEHGASVIETTRIFGPSPIVREKLRVPPLKPTPIPTPAAVPGSGPTIRLDDADLLEALAQFDRSFLMRAQVPASVNETLLAAASQRFILDATSFAAKADSGAHAGLAKLFTGRVKALRATGDALVTANDARRAAFAAYWNHFEAIDRLVKAALDQNWTIFGRVIARQSLITLGRQVDDLRRRGAQLTAAGSHDQSSLNTLADSENRFSNTLEKNAAGLTRSEGRPWVEQLRNELAGMISSRAEFAAADQQASASFMAFEQGVRAVATLTRTIADQAVKTPVAVAPAAALTTADTTSTSPTPAPAQLPAVRIYTHQTTTGFPVLARTAIAVISSAVLLLLLTISLSTVRSVVAPIRQFMDTTARLASGDSAARFERGGMREIDSLAVSLNDMAATLQTAQAITQEYQGFLEVRIEERTRQLQHLAEHDPLTGLPNRRRLIKHLEAVLHQSTGAPVAVFFLDVDNFKNFNDSRGHSAGDRVLQAVGRRLAQLTAPDSFAARLGGDEFSVVSCDCESIEQVIQRGNALVDAFHRPLLVEGRELLVTVSVGASIYPVHDTSTEALLSAADAALFRAKHLGRNQLSLFSRDLLTTVSEKFNTEQALRRAIDRKEFELVFQPEVSFDLGRIKLVEALLRWRLPDGRRVTPMQFLPTAQEFGLITAIGDWVLQSAVESAAKWHHGSWPEVRIAINVSASQLLSEDFAPRLQHLLLLHKLPPQCIEIELTENVLQTGPAIIDTLRELRELDIAVALDDFGTGFSSLSSLQHLPLTRVKLDQSLIANIDTDPRAFTIASSIIGLCEKLGLELTAEGVERPKQLRLLLEHRSICIQGFLICRPIENDSVIAAVANMPEKLSLLSLEASADAASKAELAWAPADEHGKSRRG